MTHFSTPETHQKKKSERTCEDIKGHAHGFINLLSHCSADYKIVKHDIQITSKISGQSLWFLSSSGSGFNRAIADYCSTHILAGAERVSPKYDKDGHRISKDNARKDMIGITPHIDLHATMDCHQRRAANIFVDDTAEDLDAENETKAPHKLKNTPAQYCCGSPEVW